MRRRPAPEPVTDSGIPQRLADGPIIRVWADEQHLQAVEALASAPDRDSTWQSRLAWNDAQAAAMISARRNHRDACREWARAHDRDWRDVQVNRRPRW